MFFVYAIRSVARNYIYVGLAKDLQKRIGQHNNGQNRTTRAYAPFNLIFSETFPSLAEARAREKYLKSGVGKGFLRGLNSN